MGPTHRLANAGPNLGTWKAPLSWRVHPSFSSLPPESAPTAGSGVCLKINLNRPRSPNPIRWVRPLQFAPMNLIASQLPQYLPIAILLLMAVSFGVVNILASHLLGPRSEGPDKMSTYESGMNPIGTARRRFNVRFYILAMTFLVFDVEIIFLYPWAVDFAQLEPGSPEAGLFLGRILFFLLMSIIAYVYAWKKGVFRWD